MSDFAKKIVNGENLQSFAGKMKQHIFEDLLGSKKIKYITQAEYEALTDDQKNNENIVWNIIDVDIIDYVTEEELIAKTYATETYVMNKIAEAELNDKEINLDGLATKDELNAKADKTELHSHSNKIILDGITSAKIIEWNNKSTFSGSYNDLTNKPIIPAVTNDLTNDLKTKYDAAYAHSISAHAPSNAQKNSDITKAEIEAKLTGVITSHTHNYFTRSEVGSIEWATAANRQLPTTVEAIAFWNGAYADTSSNLAYCNQGAFGTSVTKNIEDFAPYSHISSSSHITSDERAAWNAKSSLTLGTTSSTAYRGDYGNIAYNHSQTTHAPANAQKNSDITKAEIEAKLVGTITSHTHNGISGYNMWAGTQLEYDLISNKDSSTLYFIIKED